MARRFAAIMLTVAALCASTAWAQDGDNPAQARLERLWVLTENVDENAQRSPEGNIFAFTVAEREVTFVSDVNADRMRLLTPIAPEGVVTPELMTRLMQANFDTALDARYALARGVLWGVFIHPLSSLTDKDFLSAIGQTVNVASSFGTTFSSGALSFGGGDSMGELRKLLEELERKNEEPL